MKLFLNIIIFAVDHVKSELFRESRYGNYENKIKMGVDMKAFKRQMKIQKNNKE